MNLCLDTLLSIFQLHLYSDGISENIQRRGYLKRSKYFVKYNRLYKRSNYMLLLVPKLKERPAIITELHGHFTNKATFQGARTCTTSQRCIRILKIL